MLHHVSFGLAPVAETTDSSWHEGTFSLLVECDAVPYCRYTHLRQKLTLPENGFERIQNLQAGRALVFARSMAVGSDERVTTETQTTPATTNTIAIAPMMATTTAEESQSVDGNFAANSEDPQKELLAHSGAGRSSDPHPSMCLEMHIRPRITEDRGASRQNSRSGS